MTGPATRLQQKRHTNEKSSKQIKNNHKNGVFPVQLWPNPLASRPLTGGRCRDKYSGTHCAGARSGGVDPSQHTCAARGNARRGGWRPAHAAVFGGASSFFSFSKKMVIQYSVELRSGRVKNTMGIYWPFTISI
jgi:hypothetical protein